MAKNNINMSLWRNAAYSMRGNQPNFGQFFDHVKPEKLDYQLRFDGNVLHDLAYLSNYIHDARFRPVELKFKSKRLQIPLERDCWELPIRSGASSKFAKLYTTHSTLTIFPVISYAWYINNYDLTEVNFNGKETLWIDTVYFSESWFENDNIYEFIISGGSKSWQLRLTLVIDYPMTDDPKIKLRDILVPKLR